MHRLLVAIGLLAVALVGCEGQDAPLADPTPSPSPPASPTPDADTLDPAALDVGLVLAPPEAGVSAGYGESARAAAADLEGGDDPPVRRIRVVDAPNEDLRGDALGFLAEDGAHLVCTIGPHGGGRLLDLADRYPQTTFCLLGGEIDGENQVDNAFALHLPQVEGAFLVGSAAALAADGGTVGVVVADGDPIPDELSGAFLAGVRHIRDTQEADPDDDADEDGDDEDGDDEADDGDDEPAEVEMVVATDAATDATTPDAVRAATAEAAEAAYRDGVVDVLVPYGGASVVAGLVDAARNTGGLVVGGWADVLAISGDDALEVTAVSIVTRFDAALEAALRRASSRDAVPGSLEVIDAFRVVAGEAPGADELADDVRRVLDELAAGDLIVPEPQ